MSALRSVLESSTMADIYTCSVCSMKITLNVLTEHVLLHDQYSAFSYNETTKVIEPLDEVQEQLLQERHTTSHFPPKSAYTYQQEAYTYLPEGTSRSVDNHGVTAMAYSNGISVPYESSHGFGVNSLSPKQNNKTKSYSITPDLEKRLSTTSLDRLTGIQMIASVAESLGKHGHQETDCVWTDELGRMNVETPLHAGDVIGTLKLPVIENDAGNETVGLLCECSIVFNRYVSVVDSKEYSLDSKKAAENAEMSLQDIIDGEEGEEDPGEDCMNTDLEFLRQKEHEQQHSVPRGGKTGRKMEVYKYKEPEVVNEIQNELQKTIGTVPELLKDPAVVKYLEEMTGKAIEPVTRLSQTITVTNKNMESDTFKKNDEENETCNDAVNEDKEKVDIEQLDESFEAVNEEVNTKIEKVLEDKELKKSKIVVKWDQNTAGIETAENGNERQTSMDISLTDENEERDLRETYTNCSVEQDGSENDDEEQEMMDIESDIEDTKNSNENMMDTVSEKQLSLFSFKVEKFVNDIANEVKEKFSDELNIEKEKRDDAGSRKEETVDNSNDCSNENIPKSQDFDSKRKGGDVFVEKSTTSHSENNLADKNLRFSCSVCQKTVNSIKNLRKHFLTHKTHSKEPRKSLRSIDKRIDILSKKVSESLSKSPEVSSDYLLFYCMVCDKMFPSQQELREHCKIHRNDDGYSDDCVKLDGTSASDDTLTADSEIENDIRNDKVYENDIEVSKLKSQKGHKKTAVRIKPKEEREDLEDRNEGKEMSKEKLNELNRKKTISKDYICENCGEGFLVIHECMAHSEQCTETRKLKCFQGCGYTFTTRSELDFHKKFCSRRIAYLERINKELVKREFPEEPENSAFEDGSSSLDPMFECPFCHQKYQNEEKMTNHKLVCPSRPKQQCAHCSFECKGDKAMGKHLVEKHNLKPFICEQCPKSFKLKGSLRDHVRYAHTRETFTCEYCGKSFIKQSIYRSHVSIQHEGFRLVCSYCGKKFKDKRTWVVHEKSHKGAYAYACTMCKKTYNRSEQYRSHMQDMHSIEGKAALSLNSAAKELRDKLCSNVCPICKETFPLEAAYTMHMIKVHGQA